MSGISESLTEYIQKIVASPIVKEAYSKAQRLGIPLEKFIVMVLSIFFPKSKGYRIEHVDWEDYTNNSAPKKISVDVRLFLRNKLIAVFECKNWRLLPEHRYGLKDAKEQILTRFHNCGTNIKVLIISFKKQLSKKALRYLESNNIQVIETGKLIGKKDFRSKLIYSLGKQIKQLIRNFKPTVQPSAQLFSNQVLLTNSNTVNLSSDNRTSKNDYDIENTELTIDNIKHPQHNEWLNSELERLEKADKFKELYIYNSISKSFYE